MAHPETADGAMRRGALAAGIGLLVMALLAGFANFGVIERLVTDDDAAKTARDILASEGLFRVGTVSLALVAVLDVLVAWGLWVFFRPVDPDVSTLAAWFRVVYAGAFAVAIGQLVGVPNVLSGAEDLGALNTEQLQTEALLKIEAFRELWTMSLILFGVHLLFIGYLAFESGYVPRLVGVLVAVAGLGYLIDSLGTLLVSDYSTNVVAVTFVGEVVLMLWLLVKVRSAREISVLGAP